MITDLYIKDFKNISEEDLTLKPLTVVTGSNSTGKSTLLQSIVAIAIDGKADTPYSSYALTFGLHRNKYRNAKEIEIRCKGEAGISGLRVKDDGVKSTQGLDLINIEKGLYYLSANRTGIGNVEKAYQDMVSGPDGLALVGTFEKEKSDALESSLIKNGSSLTLEAQVNWWLSYILGIPMELNTEGRPDRNIEVNYKSADLPNILPSQLGAGVSYIVKIIILCLRSEKGATIMIENPEIHLYPQAQSRLAEFLTFIVRSGRQLIIETHSDTLLTKLRYEVYKGHLNPEDIVFLCKTDILTNYKVLNVDRNGNWDDEFPEGFFDASLRELLEMN